MTCNCLNCITITRASEALVQKHALSTGNMSLVVCLYIDMFSYYTVPPPPLPTRSPSTPNLYSLHTLPFPTLTYTLCNSLPHPSPTAPSSLLTPSLTYVPHPFTYLLFKPSHSPSLLTPSHPPTLTPSHLTHSPQSSDHHLFGQLGESDPLGGVSEGVWKNDRENLAQWTQLRLPHSPPSPSDPRSGVRQRDKDWWRIKVNLKELNTSRTPLEEQLRNTSLVQLLPRWHWTPMFKTIPSSNIYPTASTIRTKLFALEKWYFTVHVPLSPTTHLWASKNY